MVRERAIERIVIGPIGSPPRIREIAREMSRILPIPCSVLADPLPVSVAILEGRNQLDADRLLSEVERLADEPRIALCGVAGQDLGHPLFTHFFGRARRDGRAMVISLARLSPAFYGLPEDDTLMVRRACLEIIHELGHLAGLLHCDRYRCIMHFAPTVEAIDTRGDWFCPDCVDAFRASLPAAHRPA